MKRTTWIIIGVVVLLVLWAISSYNGLVRSRLAVDNQWAQVETQYQRRLDLIPNVVATVKGNTQQELQFAQIITQGRQAYSGATTVEGKVQAANQIESGLGRLLAIGESNPQISTTPAFHDLTIELEGTENRISVERSRYNDDVTSYNTKTATFPSSIWAKIFGFQPRTLFQADTGAQNAPSVNFSK